MWKRRGRVAFEPQEWKMYLPKEIINVSKEVQSIVDAIYSIATLPL
jgi:hypothetical protein